MAQANALWQERTKATPLRLVSPTQEARPSMPLAALILRKAWLLIAAMILPFAFEAGGLSNSTTLVLAPLFSFLAVAGPACLKYGYDIWKVRREARAQTSNALTQAESQRADRNWDAQKFFTDKQSELFEEIKEFYDERARQQQKLIEQQCETMKSQETLLQMQKGVIEQLERKLREKEV